ncbi:hypothetical protein [Vannielia sp. SX4]|uniref:hypothetical protein n=1 Tax=Vannielia sp. SX4 TaxID=3463852 RepID=UPI0040599E6F
MSALPETLEFHCRLSREEMSRAIALGGREGWPLWVFMLIGCGLVIGICAMLIHIDDWGLPPEAGLFFGVGAVFWAGLSWLPFVWGRRRDLEMALRLQDGDGGYTLRIGPEGILQAGQRVRWQGSWALVEEARDIGNATGIFMAGGLIMVPDKALPEGVSPEDFRARLERWRAA